MKLISFCINTAKNELNHIQLLLNSLEHNLSTLNHEIIVFIDSDNQNTFEWLLAQKLVFPNLRIMRNELPVPYGYQRNINEMFLHASHDIVSYIQSDMVVCKDYDIEVLKHLQPNMILCSTRIEPPLHGNGGEKLTYDFGLDPVKFDLDKFTSYAELKKQNQITEFFFAPFTLYKEVWNTIGGHDTRFRRSREDSDILIRLRLNGTKIIQVWNALVYHFTCTSSRGYKWFDTYNVAAQNRTRLQQFADSIEIHKFFRKWGKFKHDMEITYKYSISAIITGTENNQNITKFKAIEPFFNKIQTSSYFINSVISDHTKKHDVANELLTITSEQWSEYSYMFLDDNYVERIVTDDITDDIIIQFNLDRLSDSDMNSFILNLQDIMHQTDETGEFEYGIFSIHIYNKNDISQTQIIIENPVVKTDHLYKIY